MILVENILAPKFFVNNLTVFLNRLKNQSSICKS